MMVATIPAWFSAFWRDAEKRKRLEKTVTWYVLALLVCLPICNGLSRTYKIGLDLGEVRCLPWKVYFLKYGRPDNLKRGEYVAFVARDGVMGDRFQGKLVGKQLLGLPGDVVVVKSDFAWVNNQPVGKLLLMEKLGLKPGALDRTEVVPHGKVFVGGTEPRSYDGRYWGFLDQKYIVGEVRPVF